MNGLRRPVVSAGSDHAGGSETGTARVAWPAGASARPAGWAAAGTADAHSATTSRSAAASPARPRRSRHRRPPALALIDLLELALGPPHRLGRCSTLRGLGVHVGDH